MADCITTIKKVEFDLSDEQMTKATVTIDYDGDCGVLQGKRVYTKSFPARLPIVEIVTMDGGIKDYILW